ncbi:glycosyltransferase family 4 protein [Rhizobium sp. YIM 134829]|uniref:glycosyltransferase family 4 protein n=1 Tax=Rhizobium sp. YIM 134829 TaxID=3390453 RepID=UPI0039787407
MTMTLDGEVRASEAETRDLRPPRPRVLVIAEAANPEWTSVPLIGWSLSTALRSHADVLIVTQVRNREAFLRRGLIENVDFVAIDNENVASRTNRMADLLRGGSGKGWTIVTAMEALAYYSFEQAVWARFRGQLKAGAFDLVHRITPLSPTSQSLLAARLRRLRIPFVVGPLNGGLPWPKEFSGVRRKEREWLAPLRKAYQLMPAYKATREHAAAIIAGSSHTLSELPPSTTNRSFLIPENGVDPLRFRPSVRGFAQGPLRLAFVGRLVPYKGADILIEAAETFCKDGRIEILIIGDGPQRNDLEALVRERGLEAHVTFAGWVAHEELAERLADTHCLALPSIREFGGGVVLEAMALGMVPVVARYGGPAELIDPQSGIAVPFTDRQSLVDGFHAALAGLLAQPERLEQLSEGAIARVAAAFSWDAKARQLLEIYEWVLKRAEKPVFAF